MLYTSDVMVQVCFTPLKGLHWGVMVLVARPCSIWTIVALMPLFFLSYRMGLDRAGFWRASVRSDTACVTASVGESLGGFFCAGKNSILLETRSCAVFGVYYVRHL